MEEQKATLVEKRFAQWFCVLFVCLGSVVFVFKRTDLFPWMSACNPSGYSQEHYLAYCHSTRYGDYEHYALYNGIESQAIDALKEAQVLFLGNSNTQYAFSTKPVKDYFESKGVPHYLLGFGQGAQSPVALAVIKKHNLQPRMVVANIDPFFSTETNGTFQRVLNNQDGLQTEFARKQQLQRWQARTCGNPASRWRPWVCHGEAETLYRSRVNGHWLTDYYRKNKQHPVSVSTDLTGTVDAAVAAANEFINSINVPRNCVILTVTPRTGTPEQFAKALAGRLKLPLLMPELDNLVTIDHSHLDKRSADRWSQAFIDAFDRYTEPCVGANLLQTQAFEFE